MPGHQATPTRRGPGCLCAKAGCRLGARALKTTPAIKPTTYKVRIGRPPGTCALRFGPMAAVYLKRRCVAGLNASVKARLCRFI